MWTFTAMYTIVLSSEKNYFVYKPLIQVCFGFCSIFHTLYTSPVYLNEQLVYINGRLIDLNSGDNKRLVLATKLETRRILMRNAQFRVGSEVIGSFRPPAAGFEPFQTQYNSYSEFSL